ncbi:MAG: DUF1127 domain-containing protein [Alphaproteobacteria bacterium]|nr:MAG: DUF1127 domain-containing protein [Alphaproteobacteria bacterium]
MQAQALIPARLKAAIALLREWRQWQARRAEARRTYKELSRLSDRELADIGLSRWQIAEVARRSAEAAH